MSDGAQIIINNELTIKSVDAVESEIDRQAHGQEPAWPLRVAVKPGSAYDWPGVRIHAPGAGWDWSTSASVEVTVTNVGSGEINLGVRADSTGGDDGIHRSVTTHLKLDAGKTQIVSLELRRLEPRVPDTQLTGMWGLPNEAAGETRDRIDASRVTRLHVFVVKPTQPSALVIERIKPAGKYEAAPRPTDPTFFPLIDTLGQFIHREWQGKTASVKELRSQIDTESTDLDAHPGAADRDKYGGWGTGPQLEATGYFRTSQHDGRWWLVTPEGRLFWSHAINAVGEHDYTPIDERETWFADRIWEQEEFEPFLRQAPIPVIRGHFKGKQPMTFSFHQANLLRKYGPTWQATYAALAHRRVKSWGLNTIGVWSDRKIVRSVGARTAYFEIVYTNRGRRIAGSDGWWQAFPDPFDPEFASKITDQMKQLQREGITDDPWCIGFFVDNELSWKHDTYLAEATLASPADQPAKRVFVEQLKAKYADIAELNKVWGTTHKSWQDLLEHKGVPENKAGAAEDLRTFYTRLAEAYFSGCRDAVKVVAPNHLYLGCRFPYQVNALVTGAAKKYCDVMSVNWYQYSVDGFEVPGGLDLPLIIGEFHFGALDRGLFHTGLKKVANQNERAVAYKRYVNEALHHPNIVGVTWFKFSDEPNTGRWLDTENYQIGFLDVCDNPYLETIAAAREVGRDLYKTRNGQ